MVLLPYIYDNDIYIYIVRIDQWVMEHQIVYIFMLLHSRLSITETDFSSQTPFIGGYEKKQTSCENITGASLIIRLKVIAHTLEKKYVVYNDNYVIKRIELTHIFRKQGLYNVNELKKWSLFTINVLSNWLSFE